MRDHMRCRFGASNEDSRASPSRLRPVRPEVRLETRQLSNGLPDFTARFIDESPAMSLLLVRVVRLVEGGEAGANRGALGVLSFSETSVGVSSSSARGPDRIGILLSSMSVTASSSSSPTSGAFFLGGKRRRGLMADRVKRRGASSSAAASRDISSSSESASAEG